MTDFRPEDVDLAVLAASLQHEFGSAPLIGFLPGKTQFRDAIGSKLGCSVVDAERLVDTMVMRGFLRYEGTPSGAIDGTLPWVIQTTPTSES